VEKASLPSERYNREDEEFDPISNVEEPENLQDYLLTQSHIFFDDPDEIKIAEEITFHFPMMDFWKSLCLN